MAQRRSYKTPQTPEDVNSTANAGVSMFPASEDHVHKITAALLLAFQAEPLTNGDTANPELIFASGDVIMA